MFPFPDGFIFSQRVGRLLPLETICGRLTQRPMSSLGLVLLCDSGLHYSRLQIWTIYRGFPSSLGSVRAQLLLGSVILKSPTNAACREVEGLARSQVQSAGPGGSRREEPCEAVLDLAVPPTIPKVAMCPNPATRPFPPVQSMPQCGGTQTPRAPFIGRSQAEA